MPIVWVFDPHGTYGLFGGLVFGAVTFLVPTGFYLILPRRWGMALFGLESFAIWCVCILMFPVTALYRNFIMWSVVELPMYALELLGLLDDPKGPVPPRRPAPSTLLYVWLGLLVAAYVISYPYESADPEIPWPAELETVAKLFIPVPFLIVFRNAARRIMQAKDRTITSP